MNLEPPQPPTAPAPAVRPTPPTPPRIDKTPFVKNQAEEVEETTPETQARDAVAHGSGALTKRTVEQNDEPQPAASAQIQQEPTLPADTQSDYDRGQDVLREFKALDAREAQPTENFSSQTEKPAPVPKINYREGHSGVFWVFTLLFVAVAAVVVIKKFLFTGKSSIKKSELFEDSTDRLKAVKEKVKPVPIAKKPPPPKDDDKGKHFEVRV